MLLAQRLLIAGIVGLFPMMMYCLILIGLNGRRRASIIPGTWDFAGALLATSGFVLGGGPLILAGLNGGWRRFLFHGNFSDWRSLSGQGDSLAMTIWALFFVLVLGGGAILIGRRRNTTVVYNVDTEHFPAALEWVFGRLAIVWKKTDAGYDLKKLRENIHIPWRNTPAAHELLDKNLLAQTAEPEVEVRPATASLVLHPLPGSCNVTLHWSEGDGDIRRKVEGELYQLLTNIRATENPFLNWLLMAATGLFGVIVASLVFVIITTVKFRGVFGAF